MPISSKLRDKLAATRKKIQQKSGNRADVMRVPNGKNRFRLLPHADYKNPDSEEQFWSEIGKHFIKAEEGGTQKIKKIYQCPAASTGTYCPVCDAIESAARAATNDIELEILEEAKCKSPKVYINVLHLDSPDKANVPQILEITGQTFEAIMKISDDPDYGDITDLKEGTDFYIERIGSGRNDTKYTVLPCGKSKPVDEAVMKHLPDLTSLVEEETEAEAIKAVTAVNAIVGILDAPVIGTAARIDRKPEAAALPPSEDESEIDDMMEIMKEEVIEDAVVTPPESKPEPKPESKPKAKALETGLPPDDPVDDIDDMLKELEGL